MKYKTFFDVPGCSTAGAAALQKIVSGEADSLLRIAKPGSGATKLAKVLAVQYLTAHPDRRVQYRTYHPLNGELVARKVRKHLGIREDQMRSGARMIGTSVAGGTPGMPVDLIIIDNPYPAAIDPFDSGIHSDVWGDYLDNVATRLRPGGQIVVFEQCRCLGDFRERFMDATLGINTIVDETSLDTLVWRYTLPTSI